MPHDNITDEVKIALNKAGSFRALTPAERALASGQVMPSGEAGFRDFSQNVFNANYPSPTGTVASGLAYPSGVSATTGTPLGIYPTYPSGGLQGSETGIIHPNGLDTQFSNSKETKDLLDRAGITDFTIFNNYFHYYGRG